MNDKLPKKTGILGGTFNPIHTGHLILAQNAIEYCALDKVLFVPSGCSYFKDPTVIADTKHRLNMTKEAIKDNERFMISDIEAVREGNSYTCDTLTELNAQYPDTHFYFIIGADTLFAIESWKDPEVIFKSCTLVCAKREGFEANRLSAKADDLKARFGADIVIMDVPEVDISSTLIRDMLVKNRSCRYYIPDAVLDYINVNGLYKEK